MRLNIRFVVILLICILAGAEVDIFTPSLPEMQKKFNLSISKAELSLSMNFFAFCICSVFVGTLADKYSKSTIINISLLFFITGGAVCIFANKYEWFLIGRVLQGIGISGPATLDYVIATEKCSLEQKPVIIGILNSIVTLAMSLAPIIGSYISTHYHWKGNFFILIFLAVLCLIGSYMLFPKSSSAADIDQTLALSPFAYTPLLLSPEFILLLIGICFLAAGYWSFVGIAPILYMTDLGVNTLYFGFFQGVICGAFSIGSICCSKIVKKYSEQSCIFVGLILCGCSGVFCLIAGVLHSKNPFLITVVMLIFTMASVIPANILYLKALNVVPYAQGRAAALINSCRLLLTAIALQVIGKLYDATFFAIGLFLFISLMIAIVCFSRYSIKRLIIFG